MKRPNKYFRLNFWQSSMEAMIVLRGQPNQVHIQANPKSFISVTDNGITIGPGQPAKIMIQGLPGAINYVGLIGDLPFPLAMIPITPFTPFPQNIFKPPLKELLPTIRDIAILSATMVGA